MTLHHLLALAAILMLATSLVARHPFAEGFCASLGVLCALASFISWPLPA